jgi:glycosyltransferase involved in cell wall biosynthesis
MSKLRVAHIVCDLLAGGGQKSTIDLMKTTDNDVENYLILLENKRNYEPENCKILSICEDKKIYKKLDILGDYLLSLKLKKILNKHKIDIAISHMEVTARVLRFVDIDKIFYMRVDITQELESLKKISFFRYKKRYSRYRKIFNKQNLITISKDSELNISKFIKPKNIKTIYNPFDTKNILKLSTKKVETPDYPYIIQIGQGISRKRQDILLEAFSMIKNKNIKLLLLGTEKNHEILTLIEKFNLNSRVLFETFTTNPYPYIKNAKLLVVSSEREGLPRVIIESLILKTPVVSTDCKTGPKEILVDELSSFLAEVNNPIDLASKINLALKTYPKINDKHIQKFNKSKIKIKFLDYIKKIRKNNEQH